MQRLIDETGSVVFEDESVDVPVTVDVPTTLGLGISPVASTEGSKITAEVFRSSHVTEMDSVVEEAPVAGVSEVEGLFLSVKVEYGLKTDSDTSKSSHISPRSFIAPILISC